MTLAEAKAAARKAAFARRNSAFDAAGPGQADALVAALRPFAGLTLAGYAPIRTEIDPTAAMTAHDGPVCLPVIDAPCLPLRFRAWSPDCAMQDGPFGARVPASGDWLIPDVLIVPLVAFDARGGRLGYGGGYYDRTLEGLRARHSTVAIGFAFAAQQTEDLPLEPTDQPLDMIVTDSGILADLR